MSSILSMKERCVKQYEELVMCSSFTREAHSSPPEDGSFLGRFREQNRSHGSDSEEKSFFMFFCVQAYRCVADRHFLTLSVQLFQWGNA
jgi:hypothetical protein